MPHQIERRKSFRAAKATRENGDFRWIAAPTSRQGINHVI